MAVLVYNTNMNKQSIKTLYHHVRSFQHQLEENSVAAHSAQAAFFMTISLAPFMLLMQGSNQLWTALPALWAVSRCVRAIAKGLKKIQGCESKRSLVKRIMISLPISAAGWFFLTRHGNSVVVMLWLYTCMFVFFAGVQFNVWVKNKKL